MSHEVPPPFPLPDGTGFTRGRIGAVAIWHVWRRSNPADEVRLYLRPSSGVYRLTPHHYAGGIGTPSGPDRCAVPADVGAVLAEMVAALPTVH